MKNRNRQVLWILVAVIFLIATSSMAQVNGVSGISAVSNRVDVIQPPDHLDQISGNNGDAIIFLEREELTLDQSLTVDITEAGRYSLDTIRLTTGTLQSGTVINSYLIQFDPDSVGDGNLAIIFTGQVTFADEILGIITETSTLTSTSNRLGAPQTSYENLNGLEFLRVDLGPKDEIFLEANRRTVRFEFRDETEIDQMRIITLGESSSIVNGPDARRDDVFTDENRSVTIDVLDNDADGTANIDPNSLRVTTDPTDGTTSVDRENGTIIYDPDSGFTGSDSFVYEICDSNDRCDSATVDITVEVRGSGNGSDGNVTLRTLLPEADDCSFDDQASIDIEPGNRENVIRMDDETGFTTVAILSTRKFPSPNCVDVSTVTFGPSGDEVRAESCGVANVNFDRWSDVVCDFKTSELGFGSDDSTGELQADVIEGGFISETDVVDVRGARRFKSKIPSASADQIEIRSMPLGRTLMIRAKHVEIESLTIEIYNSEGKRVALKSSAGQLLRWNTQNGSGTTLANGTYIFVVTALDAGGNSIGRSINKIAILR